MVLKNQLDQHISCAVVVVQLLHSCLPSLMFSKAIVIVVAMDKEVLHWHCIFSLAVSCFAVKFIGRGPEIGANFFGISGREKS